MRVWSSFADLDLGLRRELLNQALVVTIGNFDGVHQGHQVLLARTRAVAEEKKRFSLVVTFEEHTSATLRQGSPPLLMTSQEKLDFLSQLGLSGCLMLRFTSEVARMSPEEFLLHLVKLGAKEIIVGHDFTFGKDAIGDTDFLLDFAKQYGIYAEVIPPVKVKGKIVCSSCIRGLLQEGRVRESNLMLKRPFTVNGTVVHGDHRGRTLGFPTANLNLSPDKLLPKYGVYLVRSHVKGRVDYGLANVGMKPTFSTPHPIIEVYLFDTSENLYGTEMTVEFLEFIRAEQKFSSSAALIEQMKKDEIQGRRMMAMDMLV